MDNQEKLYTGLSKAAWGHFLLLFDINLGNVSILPSFAGYFLLYSALKYLAEEQRDLLLLRPLGLLLAVWSLANWLLSWLGVNLDGRFLFLDLLISAAGLYFHFQFLTDMAALAEAYQPDDDSLSGRIRSHRTAYTLIVTVIALLDTLSQVFPWEWWPGIIVFAALITCIVALMIMSDLFRLRRCVRDGGTELPGAH